ncbi:MAG: hypothetical protein II930_01135 [Lachnospiraceae bacterium]|nr:hypothetical protein [Lachnospiraceae bacterium]
MATIYLIRDKIRKFFSYYGRFFIPAVKFFTCLLIFTEMGKHIGFYEKLANPVVSVAVSLIGMVVPSSVLVLIAAVMVLLHLYQASVVLMAIVLIVFLLLYLLLGRFDPDHGFVVLLMPILLIFRVPYLMPLFLGIFEGPITIIPMTCGTIVYYVLEVIRTATGASSGFNVEEALVLVNSVLDSILANKIMFAVAIVLAVTLTVVWFVRRLKVKYSFEISVAAGTLVCLVGFLIVNMLIPGAVSVGNMILMTLVSGLIAFLSQFFNLTLDYSRTENARFEDENYYYYVTAVPKIFVSEPKKEVKLFGKKKDEKAEEEEEEKDGENEDLEEILDEEEEFLRDFSERKEDY